MQNILHRKWDMNQLDTVAQEQCWEKLQHQDIEKHLDRADLQQAAYFPTYWA